MDMISYGAESNLGLAGIQGPAEQFAEVLAPERVAQYLASVNWTCWMDKPFGQLWTDSDRAGEDSASVVIPKRRSSDFSIRWPQVVETLANTFDQTIAEFAESVAHVHADLFLVRIDQPSNDATIPLAQATKLLESIQKMMRSAAGVTQNPYRQGGGRVSGMVRDFLAEDVRMAHTKRGSFIITVAARHETEHQEPHAPGKKFDPQNVVEPPAPDEEVGPMELLTVDKSVASEGEQDLSFSRRVMTTLARSLEATKHHLSNAEDFETLESAVEAGVRAPFVEALHEIGAGTALRGVDMTFNWSETLDPPPEAVDKVHFKPREFDALPAVRDRLKREYEPSVETVVGRITRLERDDNDTNSDGGQVILRGVAHDRERNLRLDLNAEEYEMAIAAHRGKYPLTAVGTVVKDGRSWAIQGDLQLSRLQLDQM